MVEAKLILEDGTVFEGVSFGAETATSGEVVFNTGMVGYPESFTDPSYRGQILALTYPLVGNYGVPGDVRTQGLLDNFESDAVHIRGLVVCDYSIHHSHWNAAQSLGEWLRAHHIPALSGIDTRRLTKVLREKGTMLGKIVFGADIAIDMSEIDKISDHDQEHATNFSSAVLDNPNVRDLVREVTIDKPVLYNPDGLKKIVLIDCGVKNNIIRNLVSRDCAVLRVPYDYDFLNERFDGVVISNGPGDPKMCTQTIEHIRRVLERNVPTFGICLGNQLLALAAGGRTYKLGYGHRSQNQPCILRGTKRCFITSQNHGFAVDMKSLSADWDEWFVNANDGTNEGITHKTKPFFSVQFHPESFPGPNDTNFLFDEFLKVLK